MKGAQLSSATSGQVCLITEWTDISTNAKEELLTKSAGDTSKICINTDMANITPKTG